MSKKPVKLSGTQQTKRQTKPPAKPSSPDMLILLAGGILLWTTMCPSALNREIALANPPLNEPPAITRAQSLPLTAYTIINKQRIDLEVAQTPEQQEIGLMFRKSLAQNRGMLFPFTPPRPVAFWMKNCLIPLDMVFIRNERVIAISANVPPCRKDPCPSYGPASRASVDHVLELAAGRAAALGLRVGDPITISQIPPIAR